MKKISLLSCICSIAFAMTLSVAIAQTNPGKANGIQKVTFGAVFASSANTSLAGKIKPFTLGYNLSPNLCIVTAKTYHNFLYGFGNNTFRVVNGYLLKKDLGLYTIISKSLSSKTGYVSIGIERSVRAGDVNFFLFSELGVNINPSSQLVTLGIHANIQTLLWKRK